MDQFSLQPFFDWINANPAWAGLLVFLVAMSESLLVVGLIVPGAMMMFGIGALVGTNVMGLWETLVWAFFGAIVGDGISFWIGYFFSDRVANVWPFKKKPELLEKAQGFFLKHGGKGILFGRFVGPVRPIIPAVAGMMKMGPWKFTSINVFSALLWAPAYLLPGIVFGTSIGLASQVTTRLAVIIVVAVAIVWLGYWIIKRTLIFIEPRGDKWIKSIYQWTRRHPILGPKVKLILDPDFSPTTTLIWLAILQLVLFIVLFLFMLYVTEGAQEALLDRSVFSFFQQSRWSFLDNFFVLIFQFGDFSVLSTLVLALMAWHWRRHESRLLRYWGIAFGIGVLALLIFNLTLVVPRPFVFDGPAFQSSFPSWHATMPIIVYGLIAVLLVSGLKIHWHWLAYSGVFVFVGLISFSGLFLGAHWLSDVVAGFLFGFIWLILVTTVMHRKTAQIKGKAMLASLFIVVLFATVTVNAVMNYDSDRARYVHKPVSLKISKQEWLDDKWMQLSDSYRTDLRGHRKQPLTIQWAADLNVISKFLIAEGWEPAPKLAMQSLIKYLAPDIDIDKLPVLPNLYNGVEESLILIKKAEQVGAVQYVLRLWRSSYELKNGKPIFIGSIVLMSKTNSRLIAKRGILKDFISPDKIISFPQMMQVVHRRHRLASAGASLDWDGSVFLLSGLKE